MSVGKSISICQSTSQWLSFVCVRFASLLPLVSVYQFLPLSRSESSLVRLLCLRLPVSVSQSMKLPPSSIICFSQFICEFFCLSKGEYSGHLFTLIRLQGLDCQFWHVTWVLVRRGGAPLRGGGLLWEMKSDMGAVLKGRYLVHYTLFSRKSFYPFSKSSTKQ